MLTIMQNAKLITKVLIAILVSVSLNIKAKETLNIPKMEGAKVFAEFTDELPAVVNYYTLHNEQEIISFYQSIYGEVSHTEMKRGRLTLIFNNNDNRLRVIISAQGNRRQVDVMLQ